jgi:hypothetical protein
MNARRSSAALIVAFLATAGCVDTPSRIPASGQPSAPTVAGAPSSPQPSTNPSPSDGSIRLDPVGDGPLAGATVRSVVSTPTGFALLGDAPGAQDPSRLVLAGSPDGRTWSRLSTGSAGPDFAFLAAGPLGWIATSEGHGDPVRGTVLWFSADGVTWNRVPDQAGLSTSNLQNAESNPLSAGPSGFAIVGQVTESGSSVAVTWTSRDGLIWTEATALHDKNFDRVLALPGGFIVASGGCCLGPGSAAFSADGATWRDLTPDPGSPFDPAGQVLIASVGSRLVVMRSGEHGDVQAFSGDVAGGAGETGVSWQHDPATDGLFAGAGISTATGGSGGAVVLGYDRTSLAPIAWTSTDGLAWARTALDATLFGGGVPALTAAGGSSGAVSFVAIAGRANAAAEVRPQIWRSDDGIAWSDTGPEPFDAPPVAATGPCPAAPPTAVEDFLAMAPALRPACFGDRVLKVRGVIEACECGGTTNQQATPSWLVDTNGYSAFYLSGPIVQAATGPGGFGVMIDPAHPVKVPSLGTGVELTGHFDDPAAATCRVFPLPGAVGPVVPKAQTVAFCRQAFVVTAIRKLAG